MRTTCHPLLALLAAASLLACGEDDPAGNTDPIDAGGDAVVEDIGTIDTIDTIDVIGDTRGDVSDAVADVRDAFDASPETIGDAVGDVADADADADVGPVEPGPEVTVCARGESFDPSACEVIPGDVAGTLIVGQVLTPDGVLVDGEVLIDENGLITCVACDCASDAPAGIAEVVCPAAVVSPGLINAHDHITYTQNDPGAWGDERFDHRHDWSDGLRGHTRLVVPGRASTAQVQWGELRQLISGTTSMAGSGSAPGIVRNLDASAASLEGLPPIDVDSTAFPLDDGLGVFRTVDCAYPELPSVDELDRDCWLAHVAEGIDDEARNEFLCMSSPERGGVEMLASSAALVHGIALSALDARQLASSGTGIVWSPRSNISLYGNTAPVLLYKTLGVELGIGTDWTASGSMNLLRELQCATDFSNDHLGGGLNAHDLWRMATIDNARLLGVDDAIGVLDAGRVADIALFTLGDIDNPWDSITTADPDDVLLVLRGGEAMFGDVDLIEGLRDPAACESFEDGICGAPRLLCLDDAASTTFSQLRADNASIYGLFFCETPTNEPTCTPSRPGEYDGISEGDRDGDGIANEADLCPDVFDPVRPVDDGAQPDADGDGVGDACDACPLGQLGDGCRPLPVDDRDLDGIEDADDNCVATPNSDQLNADGDAEGDACDLCDDVVNELGWACPVDIEDVKRGTIERDRRVTIEGVVTAVDGDSFWLQTADADRGETPEYNAIYVFVEDGDVLGDHVPAPGDRLRVDGAVTVYRTYYELDAIRHVRHLGEDVVTPTIVDVAAVNANAASRSAWDAVLVTVPDAEVVNLTPTASGSQEEATGEYGILGGALIDELLYAMSPAPLLGSVYRVTGIVRTPNGQLKFAPRSAEDVELIGEGMPRLLPLVGSRRFVAVDEIGPTYPDSIVVQLDRPAPADFVVGVAIDGASVLFADETLAFAEGETAAELVVTGLEVGEALVTLNDGRTTRSTTVNVYDPLAMRTIASVSPSPLRINVDRTVELEIELDAPAGPSGAEVDAAAAGGTAQLTFAATVAFGSRDLTARLPVTATEPGTVELTLDLDGNVVVVPVEVIDAIPVRPPTPANDMLVSEVMAKSVAGSGDRGEWFEMYNNSGDIIDLAGCEIYDGAGEFTIEELLVEPNTWVVFAASADAAVNGGVDPAIVYGTAMALNNNGDDVGLRCDGVVIDEIAYTSAWVADGQTYQLKDNPALLTTAANDLTANWCRATTAYGSGTFRGTPGAASDCR